MPDHHDNLLSQRDDSYITESDNSFKSHNRLSNIDHRRSQYIPDQFHPNQADFTIHKDPNHSLSTRHDNSEIPTANQKNKLDMARPFSLNKPPVKMDNPNTYPQNQKEEIGAHWPPVSVPSPRSSKSDRKRHEEMLSRSSSTNKSPRLRKPSTPSTTQHANPVQLPCGTTHSSSNAGTQNTPSMLSDGPVCRICHDGDRIEVLVSPCYCAGSVGLLHVSCLQMWLGSSNKTSCEICNFKFTLQKRACPFSRFLANPGSARDRRNMILYMLNIFLVTPLIITMAGALCYHGNKILSDRPVERYAVISLGVALVLSYSLAAMFSVRQICWLYKDWKMFHQEVILLCTPSDRPKQDTDNVKGQSATQISGSVGSRSTLGSIKLQKIKVSVTGRMARYKLRQYQGASATPTTTTTAQNTKGPQRTSDFSSDHSHKNRMHSRSRHSMSPINHKKIPDQNSHFQRQPSEPRSRRSYSGEKTNTSKDGSYLRCNTGEHVGEHTGEHAVEHTGEHAGVSHLGHQSDRHRRHSSQYSSVPTCNKDSHHQTPLRRLDESAERRFYKGEEDSGARNLPKGSRITTDPPAYIDGNRNAGRLEKADLKLMHTRDADKIFSRGGSPSDDDSLHMNLPYDDFVTKWINDQKNILGTKNKQLIEHRDARVMCQSNAREEVLCEAVQSNSEVFEKCNTPGPIQNTVTAIEHEEACSSNQLSDTLKRTRSCIEKSDFTVSAPVPLTTHASYTTYSAYTGHIDVDSDDPNNIKTKFSKKYKT